MKNETFGDIYEDFYQRESFANSVEIATKDLKKFMPNGSLKGLSFLDAGSGGGLFSLAASKLNPESITSFDISHKMISFCEKLKENSTFQKNWSISQGSILDQHFLAQFDKFDYIYCWGVVHHTGSMWQAIDNITKLVKPNGHIYLGIYNHADVFAIWDDRRFGSSLFWKRIKAIISHSPNFFKSFILGLAKFSYFFISITEFIFGRYKFKNFKQRGMTSNLAIEDWLFGHPYEYASIDEVFTFMKNKGFSLEKIESNSGLRTNHFLFKKSFEEI